MAYAYGTSKLAVEQALRDFDGAYDLGSVSLRYFNAAGADPDGEIGEAHEPTHQLVPLVLDAALGRHKAEEEYSLDIIAARKAELFRGLLS